MEPAPENDHGNPQSKGAKVSAKATRAFGIQRAPKFMEDPAVVFLKDVCPLKMDENGGCLYPSLRNILWKHSNHGVFFVEDLWRFPVEHGEFLDLF